MPALWRPGAEGGTRRHGVKLVRKHRRAILLVFGLLALASITYGALRRVGVDPLEGLRPEDAAGER